MKLATIRTAHGTRAVRIDGERAVETGHADLVDLLGEDGWRASAATATGPSHEVARLDYAPLLLHPEKVICVGLNYRSHIMEMGRELPEHPTLFAKYARALVGAHDDLALPPESAQMDWEAE